MSKKASNKPNFSFESMLGEVTEHLRHKGRRNTDVMVIVRLSRNRKGTVTGWTKSYHFNEEIPESCPPMEVNKVVLFFSRNDSKGKSRLEFRKYTQEVWNFLVGAESATLVAKETDLRDVSNRDFKWLEDFAPVDKRLDGTHRVREYNLDVYDEDTSGENDDNPLEHNINTDIAFELGQLFGGDQEDNEEELAEA